MASQDFKEAVNARAHRLMGASSEVRAAFRENQREAEKALSELKNHQEATFLKDYEAEKSKLLQQHPKFTLDPFGMRKERRQVEIENQANVNVRARNEEAMTELETVFVNKADKILGIEDSRSEAAGTKQNDGQASSLGRHDLYEIPVNGLNGRQPAERNPIDWSAQRSEAFEKAMGLEVRERFNDNSKAPPENIP